MVIKKVGGTYNPVNKEGLAMMNKVGLNDLSWALDSQHSVQMADLKAARIPNVWVKLGRPEMCAVYRVLTVDYQAARTPNV